MEENEIKCIYTGKEEIKLLVCDMILYIENSRESTKNLLELIVSSTWLQDTKSIYNDHLYFY